MSSFSSSVERFVLATAFIEFCSIGLLLPVMPVLYTHLSSSLSLAVIVTGTTLAGFGLAQFISAPLFGRLAEIFGVKKVLYASLAATSLGLLVTASASSLWLVVTSRVATGCVQHSILLANVFISENCEEGDLAQEVSRLSASAGLGFIAGALTSSWASSIWLQLPIALASLLTFANALSVHHSLSTFSVTSASEYALFSLQEAFKFLGSRWMCMVRSSYSQALIFARSHLVFAFALCCVSYYMVTSILPIYAMLRFGWHSHQLAVLLIVYGVLLFVSQGWLANKVLQRLTTFQVSKLAIASSGLSVLLYGFASSGIILILLMTFNILGYLAEPMLRSVIASRCPLEHQGEIMGALGSCNSIGIILGPILGGALLVPYTYSITSPVFAALPFVMASAFYLSALALLQLPLVMRFFVKADLPS